MAADLVMGLNRGSARSMPPPPGSSHASDDAEDPMRTQLDDQRAVVVITGASAGVGRATARAFARRGACIGLIARGRSGLEATKRDVEALGGRAIVFPADVAEAEAMEAAAAAIERAF